MRDIGKQFPCDQGPIVIATILPARGDTGVQTHFNTLCNYLSEQGRPAVVLSPDRLNRWLRRMHSVPRRLIAMFSTQLALWWEINANFLVVRHFLRKELRHDAGQTVYAQDIHSARAALQARRSLRQRVVLAVHFNRSVAEELAVQKSVPRGSQLCRWLEEWQADVMPKVDALIYFSAFMKDAIESTVPAAAAVHSIILPNFVPPPLSVDLTMGNDLISIGTLEPRKNQQYLLHVLAHARNAGRRYTLTIVGQGDEAESLKLLAQELGVDDQVCFLGYLPDAARLIPGHRVYVHSAIIENFPIVLVEAMSCGLPVLAPPVGGIPEVFSDGVEGFYWPLDNAAAGAQKLISLLDDEALYDRKSRAARTRYINSLTTQRVAPRLQEFLDRSPLAVS